MSLLISGGKLMQKGWIKLHRKFIDNEIWRFDPTAWRVFEYLLARADKDSGEVKTAYSTMAGFLNMPKSTLHKSIKRLKKAKMVNSSVNANYTTFYILNWSRYQLSGERLGERSVNARETLGGHIQEIRIENKINTTNVVFGKPEITGLFDYWQKTTGLEIRSKTKANRRAAHNMLKKYGEPKLRQLIDGVALAQGDRFAPRISDFVDLQAKTNALIVWGRQREQGGIAYIS